MKNKEFQKLVQEIHRVNKGWHCFEMSNRFLESNNKSLQNYYLKQKNTLQKQLQEEYSEMINILEKDNTGFESIEIKEEYQFEIEGILCIDACHKENKKGN